MARQSSSKLGKCPTCDALILAPMTSNGKRIMLGYPPEKRFVITKHATLIDTYVEHTHTKEPTPPPRR